MEVKISKSTILAIEKALSQGKVVEVKKEKENVVVIEITRKVIDKTIPTGEQETVNKDYR